MGWPLRMFDSTEIYFVTVRCFQGRLLLRPSRLTNEIVAGVLARASRLCSTELFGFVFASNHFHLIVRAPDRNLPRFMQFLLSNISKKVGRVVDWRGSFWERRYSAEPILDDHALLGRLRYVLAHGVKERLVRRCREWPGLSSLGMLLEAPSRPAKWFNWTRRWVNRGHLDRYRFDEEWVEEERLTVTTVPNFVDKPEAAQRRFFERAIAAIEREAALDPSPVLGIKKILAQSPHFRPARPARRPRPLCHAATRKIREFFRERYRSHVRWFLEASRDWRRGVLDAVFPDGAVRPFLWRVPLSAAT